MDERSNGNRKYEIQVKTWMHNQTRMEWQGNSNLETLCRKETVRRTRDTLWGMTV